MKDIVDISQFNIVKRHDNYYILPKTTINFDNLNVASIGTLLGTANKDTFKLSHNFYHVLGHTLKNKYELKDIEIFPYLQGQELDINCNAKGICTVTYLNIPVGGGKISNEKLKNYYPKELRIK